MELKEIAVFIVCIIGGLLVIVSLGAIQGGNWQTVAESIIPVSVMIGLFGLVVATIVRGR